MKQKIYNYSLLFLVTLLSSCATVKYAPLDVKKAAQITFPENIVNITIVDNAGMVMTDSIIKAKDLDVETVLQGKTKDVFVQSLTQFLKEDNYFYGVNFYPRIFNENIKYDTQGILLSSTIQKIAKETDADAILSIDLVNCSYQKALIRDNYGFFFSGIQGEIDLSIRIYDKNGNNLANPITFKDSQLLGSRLGEVLYSGAYEDFALQASENVLHMLIPYWEQQERYYYLGKSKQMKEAEEYAKDNQWAMAARHWGTAYEETDKSKQKAQLAANIALANEYLDDVDNAVTWIRIASNDISEYVNTTEYTYINWYKLRLLERQQSRDKLLEQIGVEEIEISED